MPERVIHFHTAFKNLLAALDPGEQPSGNRTFPVDLSNGSTRIVDGQSAVEWLRAVHARTSYRHHLQILDYMAFVLDVTWETRNEVRLVSRAHCQAVVVGGATIDEVVDGADPKRANYFRLDHEPQNLGQYVFPDPYPHVHSESKGEPRFALSEIPTVPHVDFFELLLRNYARPVWDDWALKVAKARVVPGLAPASGAAPALEQTRQAFAGDRYDLLRGSLRVVVRNWKRAMRREKRRMTALARDPDVDAITY